MSKPMEFLRYDVTPGEKHLGIATVRYDRSYIFRYKISPKDTGGFYCQPASLKVTSNGKDNYFPCFSLDSSFENDELKAFVLESVQKIWDQQNPSAFSQSATQRPAFSPPNSPSLSGSAIPTSANNIYQQQAYQQPQQSYQQQTFSNQGVNTIPQSGNVFDENSMPF